ncbi:MAG: hypothetical protein AB7K24_02730 [Gemmataceae bacterium]
MAENVLDPGELPEILSVAATDSFDLQVWHKHLASVRLFAVGIIFIVLGVPACFFQRELGFVVVAGMSLLWPGRGCDRANPGKSRVCSGRHCLYQPWLRARDDQSGQ